MKNVLERVLEKITPTQREKNEIEAVLVSILGITDNVIGKKDVERTVAGSFIRDTWLPDKKEFDLFLLFPVSLSRKDLEKEGLRIGREIMKRLKGSYEIAYAEHPYVKGKFGKFAMDVVPCYKVESASKIKSAVDRTPFHNVYITENLRPEMSEEVRLLKQFCKASRVYGSDIRTQGFSGYLCELLIINYGSFRKLVQAAAKWMPGDAFMDLKGHGNPGSAKLLFRDQPLVVIDPTDPKRNVAAALSPGNFMKFVKQCSSFVKKPRESFFTVKGTASNVKKLRSAFRIRGTKLIAVETERPGIVDDILWSQLRKTASRISGFLSDQGFSVMQDDVWADEKRLFMVFEMETWSLPAIRKVVGPPIFSKTHSRQFVSKYKKGRLAVEGTRWVAYTERKYRDAVTALKGLLKGSPAKLRKEGIRSHIAKAVASDFRIMEDEKAISAAKNSDFAAFLDDFFHKNL